MSPVKSAEVWFRRRRRLRNGSESYGIRIAAAEMLGNASDAARALGFLLEAVDQDHRVQGVSLVLDHPILLNDPIDHRGFWVFVHEPERTESCKDDMLQLGERLRVHLTELRSLRVLQGKVDPP